MKKMKSILSNQRGLTLTEIIIVMSLLAIIGSFVATKVFDQFDDARVSSTKIQMKQLGNVLNDYRRVCATYPLTDQGIQALLEKPGGRDCKNYPTGGFIEGGKVPKDSWDREFEYTSDGKTYLLKSKGADGEDGGEGRDADIASDQL